MATVDSPSIRKLVARLRALNPVKVRVWCGEESRDVAVPTRRRKWGQVVEAIEAQPWTRLELLDKAGAALGYHDNDAPTDLEPLDGGGAGGASPLAIERHLSIMLRAQEVALSHRDKDTAQVLGAMAQIMITQNQAVQGLVAMYQQQIAVAQENAYMKAEAEGGDVMKQVAQIAEAAPHVMPLLMPLIGLLTGGRALPAAPKAKTKPTT